MAEQDKHGLPDLIIAEPEFLTPWLMNGGIPRCTVAYA